MVHDFRDQLQAANSHAEAPWVLQNYKHALHDMISIERTPDGSEDQLRGIDVRATLAGGVVLKIDEKFRTEEYPDIALEIWSVYGTNRREKGWAVKSGYHPDIINYVTIPSQRFRLLPCWQVRRMWQLNGRKWYDLARERPILGKPHFFFPARLRETDSSRGFHFVVSENYGYDTVSVSVPEAVIERALLEAMIVSNAKIIPIRKEPIDSRAAFRLAMAGTAITDAKELLDNGLAANMEEALERAWARIEEELEMMSPIDQGSQ